MLVAASSSRANPPEGAIPAAVGGGGTGSAGSSPSRSSGVGSRCASSGHRSSPGQAWVSVSGQGSGNGSGEGPGQASGQGSWPGSGTVEKSGQGSVSGHPAGVGASTDLSNMLSSVASRPHPRQRRYPHRPATMADPHATLTHGESRPVPRTVDRNHEGRAAILAACLRTAHNEERRPAADEVTHKWSRTNVESQSSHAGRRHDRRCGRGTRVTAGIVAWSTGRATVLPVLRCGFGDGNRPHLAGRDGVVARWRGPRRHHALPVRRRPHGPAFARSAIAEYLVEPTRAISPCPGVDAAAVLRDAVAARRRGKIRDGVLLALVLVSLFTSTALTLAWLVFGIAVAAALPEQRVDGRPG